MLTVTGGYIDPRTGTGRVEHRRGPAIRVTRRDVIGVRTRGLVSRVKVHLPGDQRARMRLVHAQALITGGRTTLRLDEETFGDVPEGVFRITGGRLDAETLAGDIGHTGVLPLGPLQLRDLGVRPGEAVSAQVGDVRPDIGTLGPPEPRIRRQRLTIGPQRAHLTAAAADGLNFSFHTERFHAGMLLGTVLVRARLRG